MVLTNLIVIIENADGGTDERVYENVEPHSIEVSRSGCLSFVQVTEEGGQMMIVMRGLADAMWQSYMTGAFANNNPPLEALERALGDFERKWSDKLESEG